MPRLGMGTWHMGESAANRAAEVAALRLGLDLGIGLIDTAEIYGEGGAEEVVGEALRGRRGEVFLVSKFYPHHASRREPEFDLIPWCARHGVDVMGYSPLDEGPLARHPALVKVAKRLGILPAQVAIAWILRTPQLAAIPKASRPEHVGANAACRGITLDGAALEALDSAFPAPRSKMPLEMI